VTEAIGARIDRLERELKEAIELLHGTCLAAESVGPWGDDYGTTEARVCDHCGGGTGSIDRPELAHKPLCPYGRARRWLAEGRRLRRPDHRWGQVWADAIALAYVHEYMIDSRNMTRDAANSARAQGRVAWADTQDASAESLEECAGMVRRALRCAEIGLKERSKA
jgi:hypothetical protein